MDETYSAIPTTSSFRTLTWQTQPSATHVASCVHHGWHSFKRKHAQSSKILPLVDYSGLYYLWYIGGLSRPMWSELPWTNHFNPFHLVDCDNDQRPEVPQTDVWPNFSLSFCILRTISSFKFVCIIPFVVQILTHKVPNVCVLMYYRIHAQQPLTVRLLVCNTPLCIWGCAFEVSTICVHNNNVY